MENIKEDTQIMDINEDNITKVSRDINSAAWKYIKQALGEFSIGSGRPFVICEYGCGTGTGSFNVFSKIIGSLMMVHGDEQDVLIYYSDLLCNDFNALFQNLNKEAKHIDSGEENHNTQPNVFGAAIAKSFYERCLPNNMVRLGYSAWCMHWLSKVPRVIEDTVHSWETSSTEVQEMFATQAEEDWESNLIMRAKELVEGGHFVIQLAARTNDDEYSGCTQNIKTDFFQNLNQLYRKMCDERIVQEEEFVNVSKGFYARTVAELSKPFENSNSEVSKLGLRLENIEIHRFSCPFNTLWKESNSNGNIKESVKNFIQSIRVWNEHTWYTGLSESRSAEDKQRIVEELYTRYENQILQSPEEHGFECIQCAVHFSKRKCSE